MYNFITSYEEWREIYKKAKYNIWYHISISNDKKIYLRNYEEWFDLKEYCEQNKLNVLNIQIRYRSHVIEIDTSNSDGVYLVKSLLSKFSGEVKNTITVGLLQDKSVEKTVWLLPELIEHRQEIDPISRCFEKCIIHHERKKT